MKNVLNKAPKIILTASILITGVSLLAPPEAKALEAAQIEPQHVEIAPRWMIGHEVVLPRGTRVFSTSTDTWALDVFQNNVRVRIESTAQNGRVMVRLLQPSGTGLEAGRVVWVGASAVGM